MEPQRVVSHVLAHARVDEIAVSVLWTGQAFFIWVIYCLNA